MNQEAIVVIVGAGPAGLATSACLTLHSIPHVILEREDCFAPLWKKYSYDRLHLNVVKRLSTLPHVPFPSFYPKFISKDQLIQYLDGYVSQFNLSPLYHRCVESAIFDGVCEKRIVKAKNLQSGEIEEYKGRFLVVATGEQTDPYTPELEGLTTFPGDVLHSTKYRNGKAYGGKDVLVVGCGNSGMEIALDLANHGAKTSIVVRSPIHILSREVGNWAAFMLHLKFPVWFVDWFLVMISKLIYGDLSKHGIIRPKEGPLFLLSMKGKNPVADVGTCEKIKLGQIQVLPAITSVRGNEVVFGNGRAYPFDTIVLCTGFKKSVKQWLKGDDYLMKDDGLAKQRFPNHWKGKNGLYAIGLSKRGFEGINRDAQNIANDIKSLLG